MSCSPLTSYPAWLLSYTVALTLVWASDANQVFAAESPSLDIVLAAWKVRESKITSASAEWTGTGVIGKGSRNNPLEQKNNAELRPPTDMRTQSTYRLVINGDNMRTEQRYTDWAPARKRFVELGFTTTIKGGFYKLLMDNVGDFPEGMVKSQKRSTEAAFIDFLPWMVTLRGGTYAENELSIKPFSFSGRVVEVDQSGPCWEFVQRGNNTKYFYFSPQRDYLPVRYEVRFDDKIRTLVHIEYKVDAVIGWIPNGWKYILSNKDGSLRESIETTLKSFTVNSAVDDAEFDIKFPPGTRVQDHSSGQHIEYVIQHDGEPGRKIHSRLNPSYSDLVEKPSRFQTIFLFLLLGGPFVIVIVYLLRRYRGSGPRLESKTVDHPTSG